VIALVFFPLALQALAMVFDELHFHRRRGLPRWERIGHPLDTSTVLACLAVAAFAPPTRSWLVVYGVLGAFSCFFITKDEPVHARLCEAGEHWLHAVLFVLHPVVLAAVAVLWLHGLHALVLAQGAVTLAFGAYQTAYWNVTWRPSWWQQTARAR
jgi:hypothetical protein